MKCPFARKCDEVKELEARIVRLEKENGRLRRSLAAHEHTLRFFSSENTLPADGGSSPKFDIQEDLGDFPELPGQFQNQIWSYKQSI